MDCPDAIAFCLPGLPKQVVHATNEPARTAETGVLLTSEI
jgi:hypothetical protein